MRMKTKTTHKKHGELKGKITLSLSPQGIQMLSRIASQAGLSRSEFIELMIRQQAASEKKSPQSN